MGFKIYLKIDMLAFSLLLDFYLRIFNKVLDFLGLTFQCLFNSTSKYAGKRAHYVLFQMIDKWNPECLMFVTKIDYKTMTHTFRSLAFSSKLGLLAQFFPQRLSKNNRKIEMERQNLRCCCVIQPGKMWVSNTAWIMVQFT